MVPNHFCWTRFGTEAGEGIGTILARKERERIATNGMFLWGIGTSVGPAIRELVLLEKRPMVLFSPMRSKPKTIDVAPSGILQWTYAQGLDGSEWPIPDGINVTSRQGSEGGRDKRSHFALVCKSSAPLVPLNAESLVYEQLVNLRSKNKLGASQVTAVVQRVETELTTSTHYPVAFGAELVYPYFVRLERPVNPSAQLPRSRGIAASGYQPSLLAA